MKLALAVIAVSALAVGCGTNTVGTTTSSGSTGTTTGGSSTGTTGTSGTSGTGGTTGSVQVRPSYPAEPGDGYQARVNHVISNYGFDGYLATSSGTQVDQLQGLSFNHFDLQAVRNLTNASGQPFRYVLLNLSAGWCGPCNDEAQEYGLSGANASKISEWEGKGGLFLTVMVDGYAHNTLPVQADVNTWIDDHQVQSPMAADLTGAMFVDIGQVAFPANLLINLDTMVIEAAGYNDPSVYTSFDQKLNQ